MASFVVQEFIAARICGRTLWTLKRFYLIVNLGVSHQIGSCRKRSGTLLANVRLQTAMNAHVFRQVGVTRKVLTAHRATERTHARVND